MQARRLIALALGTLAILTTKAQDLIVPAGQSVGVAGIVALSATDDMRSVNPSLMSDVERLAVAVSYLRPFGFNELSQKSLKAVAATPFANAMIAVAKSGSDDSYFTEIGGGLARKWGKWGMGLEYYAVIHSLWNNERYASSFSRVGMHFRPSKKWLLSLAIHSIEQREIVYETTEAKIEAKAWLGLKWMANNTFAILLETEKPWEGNAEGKMAVAIYPADKIDLSVGFSSIGQSLSAGVGYKWQGADIHVGIMHHERLGVSLGATVGYTLGRKQ